jgi:hypothetical protein
MRRPAIDGIDHPKVLTYLDVLARGAPVGKRVAIIGAGGIGFDVAEFLLHDASAPRPQPLQDWTAEWGVDLAARTGGGLVAPAAPHSARQVTLLQRKTSKPGAGLGKTTGWVHRATLLRHGGLVSLLLIVVGTVSGLAMVLSVLGFAEVRTWNRVVVLIAFFAVLTLAIGLEWCIARLGRGRRWVAALLAVAVVAFGLWDAARPLRIDQGTQVRVNEAMQSVVTRIEQQLPPGAAVFQLPVIPYPEYLQQYARVYDYEELLPYLWSRDLRWSYGATKGRPEADWQQRVDSADPAASLAGLVGLGFQGILMDTYVYEDGGAAAMASLVPVLGQPTIVGGPEGRFRFWDLRGHRTTAGLSDAAVRDAARRLVGPTLLARLPSGSG